MGHDHDHAHHDHAHHHHHAPGRIGTAFLLNVSFTLFELVGAWMTNSTAIAADAVHDLGDSLALAFAWFMERTAKAPPTRRFTFGFRRLSALGAVVNAAVIVGGSVVIALESIPRLFAPPEPYAEGMIVLAVIGVIVNGIAAWRVHDATGLNARLVTWHLLEDVLGWVAVLIGAAVMAVFDLPILDPLLSLAVASFVSINALRHGRSAVEVLLQAAPSGLDTEMLCEHIAEELVVQSVRHLHLWSEDGERHMLSAELVVDGSHCLADLEPVRARIRERLGEAGIAHAILEFSIPSSGIPDCGAPR